ncbi:MAG: cation diffusion facilitator family transporter [Mariprofundaceae bacterium]|nr:cation diffusion facilitator family transporter [Mariprofundaceae bacterium]
MSHGSLKAVVTAVVGNSIVTLAKFVGFSFSGSSALLAEAVHSLVDTINQALLWVGIVRSTRKADAEHQLGYGQERYFWNLVSAVTIFFVGCAYTINHAIGQLQHGNKPEISAIAFAVIALAFIIEGYSFWVALQEFRRQSKAANTDFWQYFEKTRDPTTLAVLVEDSAAMFGLSLALIGMLLSAYTGSAVFDGVAAMLIGVLMGVLAFYLASSNRKYLLNRSDEPLNEHAKAAWAKMDTVQNVHHVRSIVLSPEKSLLVAEVELREESLFADMKDDEVRNAICFMNRLDGIRRELEKKAVFSPSQPPNETENNELIYIEFVLPDSVKE